MTRARNRLWPIGFLWLVPTLAAGAGATPNLVVLVWPSDAPVEERWAALEAPLAHELALAGFELRVVTVPFGGKAPLEWLPGVADSQQAVAAIHLDRLPGTVETRIALQDAVTRKLLVRTIPDSQLGTHNRENEVALRVVELLHASLIEIRLPATARAGREPTPEVVERAVEEMLPQPPARHWSFRLGAGAALFSGGFPALPTVGGAIGRELSEHWKLELSLDSSLSEGWVSGYLGRARIGLGWVQTRLAWLPRPGQVRWSPRLAAGIGGLLLWARGTSAFAGEVRSGVAPATLLSGEAALAYALTRAWSLVGALALHLALPELAVYFDQEAQAGVGRIHFSVGLAAEWRL